MMENETFCYEEEKQLTVFKTSHFFVGDGFTVYDSNGEVVFRVDSYGGSDSKDQSQLVLMNASGKCLLTVRKKVSLIFMLNFHFFPTLNFKTSSGGSRE